MRLKIYWFSYTRRFCMSKRAEHQLRLSEEDGDYSLKPGSDVGSGKPHDPEKKRLSEIIEALNDIFGAEVSDDDQLQFLTGIAQRISRQEDVMAQVNNHSVEQVMHGLFPKRVLDTVLDAMTDHENCRWKCWITKPRAARLRW